jgi:hypothetical protein
MPTFIGLAFALVLLYLWLLGHWFARVVMVLALAVLFGGVAVSHPVVISGLAPALARAVSRGLATLGRAPVDLLSMELFHY